MKEEKEKKAKKQFMLFQELVSFAKKAAAKKEILSKMAEKMEREMKGKFVAFKKCLTEGKCKKGESGESDEEKKGSGMDSSEEKDESKEKEMEGKRMGLFMEMMGMM